MFIQHSNGQKLNNDSWQFTKGFCEQGNTMVQCSSNGWGRAGYVSKSVLKANDDGRLDITIKETNRYQMIGLGRNSTTGHYRNIDYALYIARNRLYIYENGGRKLSSSYVLSVGQKISVVKKGSQIQYFYNGRPIYTSRTAVNKDLHVSSSVHSKGAQIPEISASFERVQYSVSYKNKATWQHTTGYCNDGKELRKCKSRSWGNAGYSSNEMLLAGEDGGLEYVISELDKHKMLGFSVKGSPIHYNQLKFAIYQNASVFTIYESGRWILNGSKLSLGDVISIKKLDNQIHYYHNNKRIHVSRNKLNYDVVISGVGYETGSILDEVFTDIKINESNIRCFVATTKRNSNQFQVGEKLCFSFTEKYTTNTGAKLNYKIFDLTNNGDEVTAPFELSVKRGFNQYTENLSDLIKESLLITGHLYRIKITGEKEKVRFIEFTYNN